MSIEDLLEDIEELCGNDEDSSTMCEDMKEIANMYEEDRHKCKELQDAFRLKYWYKINIL